MKRSNHYVDPQSALRVNNLVKKFNDQVIVNDLSFYVNPGEVVGLLGPNGAGKTTAFYITMGLIQPDGGHVYFQNNDITNKPIHERAQMGLGYLAQEPSIFRHLTVEENILCILENMPLPRAERRYRLERVLKDLHLEKLAKKLAISLSGGERRRLEITRALVTNPSFLLLDEPFANVDPLTIQDVKQMIRMLAKRNIGILITDHNAREILSIVDRSYLIREGKVMLSGTVDELLASAEARRSYLGENFTL
ncbi:MAG: putative transporter ATP-binding protein [Chlamydiales bacterium]|jgi:lipopolysaccharide export system ATP-binding protein|nr:putative transporter ATP-binding protein [Chlamydiales bacterium]